MRTIESFVRDLPTFNLTDLLHVCLSNVCLKVEDTTHAATEDKLTVSIFDKFSFWDVTLTYSARTNLKVHQASPCVHDIITLHKTFLARTSGYTFYCVVKTFRVNPAPTNCLIAFEILQINGSQKF